jgi:uncharacterized protein YcbX
MNVCTLTIYPVKSLGGIEVKTARVTDRGLEYDRRWMLVDEQNRFISQRELPQMALLRPELTPAGLIINYMVDNSRLLVPYKPQTAEFIPVTIWDDSVIAQKVSPLADAWFSKILGRACTLVYMPDDCRRLVDPGYADNKITSLSDAYPSLMISQATFDDLSKRVGMPIQANRFRPNIVFSGGHPFIEDEMARFTINGIRFYGVKLCARCPIPGIDQQTGVSGKEPLKTLATYRRRANNIYVGQNLVHDGEGIISVGDEIKVVAMKPAAKFDR